MGGNGRDGHRVARSRHTSRCAALAAAFRRAPGGLLRQRGSALAALGEAVRLDLTAAVELVIEYAVQPPKGEGKASFTDLMVRCADASLAIEAKYTEPRYETVGSWLGPNPTQNRQDVLSGWLSLISSVAGKAVEVESVRDLPYQLIHRTASACSTDVADRALVHLIFGEGAGAHYVEDIAALDRILGEPSGLAMHVFRVPVQPEPAFTSLAKRWDAGERELGDDVRQALLAGPLFRFGPLQALYDRPRSRIRV